MCPQKTRNGERIMNGKETRECRLYDKNSCAVGFLRKKKISALLKYALVVVAIIACAMLVTWILRSENVLNRFTPQGPGGNVGNNLNPNGANTTVGTDRFHSEEEECDSLVADSEETVDETKAEETETCVISETNSQNVSCADLSYAEKGNGYIINYSGAQIDVEGLLEVGFQNAKYSYSERPVVLILHTHTSEGYYGMDKSNPIHTLTKSVVAVGEKIVYELNSRGISSVHCSVIHDSDGYPYTNARETIETMLRIYPTIEYVIDLHRLDLTDEKNTPISAISPTGIAQMRLTVSSDGKKPRDNLALALALRQKLNSNNQRLCMPIVYTNSSYNAPLSQYYLKIDVGSLGNDAAEALAAAEIFAETFADVLKK